MATEQPPLLGEIARLRAAVRCPLIVSQAFHDRAGSRPRCGGRRPGRCRASGDRRPGVPPQAPGAARHGDPPVCCLQRGLPTVRPGVALLGPTPTEGFRASRAGADVRSCSRPAVGALSRSRRRAGWARVRADARPRRRRDVVLFEARDEIGGSIEVAARRPSGRAAAARRLLPLGARGQGVEDPPGQVRMRMRSPAWVRSWSRSAGGKALPQIEGIELALSVSDALTAGQSALVGAERVVVVDDGFGWWPSVSAVELAIAAGATSVTVLTPSGSFATGLPAEARPSSLPACKERVSRRARSWSSLAWTPPASSPPVLEVTSRSCRRTGS